MKVHWVLVPTLATVLLFSVAKSGHEVPVYPSFYPHEIEIRTIVPEDAGDLLREGKLHAYIGGTPVFTPSMPAAVTSIETLGSYILVRLNPESPLAREPAQACAAIDAVVHKMGERAGAGFVFHPYPVTPFHGDYLYHADRAQAERERLLSSSIASPTTLTVRASEKAHNLVPVDWLTEGTEWTVTIEEVSAARLVADETIILNGWVGPRWARSGWYQAYRVLGDFAANESIGKAQKAIVARLQANEGPDAVERINLELQLVEGLAAGCQARVAGYTVKREFINVDSSAGIENVSFDTIEGLSSPMFLRTVKLKDFPWNGWLNLGVPGHPDAAWNPIAGFNDPFGRLVWYAVGDQAAIPSPYESAWTFNRISELEGAPRK